MAPSGSTEKNLNIGAPLQTITYIMPPKLFKKMHGLICEFLVRKLDSFHGTPSCQISPSLVQRVAPVQPKKTKNWPPSKNNTGRNGTARHPAGNKHHYNRKPASKHSTQLLYQLITSTGTAAILNGFMQDTTEHAWSSHYNY